MVNSVSLRARIPFRPAFHEAEFGKLHMPVLLLVGEGEIMYDAGAALSRARQLIPHVQAELVSDAGHMLATDQPEAVSERMLRFLRQKPSSKGSQYDFFGGAGHRWF